MKFPKCGACSHTSEMFSISSAVSLCPSTVSVATGKANEFALKSEEMFVELPGSMDVVEMPSSESGPHVHNSGPETSDGETCEDPGPNPVPDPIPVAPQTGSDGSWLAGKGGVASLRLTVIGDENMGTKGLAPADSSRVPSTNSLAVGSFCTLQYLTLHPCDSCEAFVDAVEVNKLLAA